MWVLCEVLRQLIEPRLKSTMSRVTSIFVNLDKYIQQFRQIHLAIFTNTSFELHWVQVELNSEKSRSQPCLRSAAPPQNSSTAKFSIRFTNGCSNSFVIQAEIMDKKETKQKVSRVASDKEVIWVLTKQPRVRSSRYFWWRLSIYAILPLACFLL